MKLGSKELRASSPSEKELAKLSRNPIYLVLDEIIDTYNIGSLFRLADAVGVEKMYLCGNMEFPPSSRIHKSAVGTENWVSWEKRDSTREAIRELKEKDIHIVCVEQSKRAISYKNLRPPLPVAIVVGNESYGMDERITAMADTVVELPMYGINNSFNVWGSAAVVAYKILEQLED